MQIRLNIWKHALFFSEIQMKEMQNERFIELQKQVEQRLAPTGFQFSGFVQIKQTRFNMSTGLTEIQGILSTLNNASL